MKPTAEEALGIDYFGRGHWLTRAQVRLSIAARRRMFEHWRRYADPHPGTRVLDVGSTPDRERADSNCMIPWFQQTDCDVTLYSPENLAGLDAIFPGAAILPAAGFGAHIPAPDCEYDWVTASAVLEHVGSRSQQVEFVRDCARVGRGLFLTTPNRRHWLEFHTKLPLIHWLPRPLHRRLLALAGMETWSKESHLRLLDVRDLRSIAEEALAASFTFSIRTVWSLGMPSNLVLLARRA